MAILHLPKHSFYKIIYQKECCANSLEFIFAPHPYINSIVLLLNESSNFIKHLAGEAFLLCPVKGSNEGKCMITDARGVLRIADEYDMVNRRYVFTW